MFNEFSKLIFEHDELLRFQFEKTLPLSTHPVPEVFRAPGSLSNPAESEQESERG